MPTQRTIADDLDDERARLFVGRRSELARLDALLDAAPTRRVVAVTGPGGSGKTELLMAFRRRVEARGERVAWLDALDVPPSEMGFGAAVSAALAVGDGAGGARVLIIDRFELVQSLEGWFRERLLPSLDVRVAFASRMPPGTTWSSSAGWPMLFERIELQAIEPDACAEYLALRGLPAERHADVVSVTRGYALALALFADVAQRGPPFPARLSDQPQIVQLLLERLLEAVPDDLHRHALWSAALARNTSEELLVAMVGAEHAARLFTWLQRLSFMRLGPAGLAPHDLVRDVLVADLAWRYPQLRRQLLARAARYYRAAMARHPGLRVAFVMEAAFLWRDEVPLAALDASGLHTSEPRPGDWPELEAMVVALHGPVTWSMVRHWSTRGGELVVVRRADGRPQAVALYLWLQGLDAAAVAHDPGVARLHAYLSARGELAGSVCWRLQLDRDTLEAPSPSTTVLTAYEFERFVCRPELSDGYSAWLQPELGLQTLPPGMLARCPEADFTLDGHDYHVVRTTACGKNHLEWCMQGIFDPLANDEDEPGERLDRATFDEAVRAALRDFHRPESLLSNPLMQTRMRTTQPGASMAERADALRCMLREGARALLDGGGDDLDPRIIEHTYFAARSKQLKVALELNLPYGSYRRRLGQATSRLVEWLWVRGSM